MSDLLLRARTPAPVTLVLLATVALVLGGCSAEAQGTDTDPEQVDSITAPTLGACRELTPDDVAMPSNASRTVDCGEQHTAETFAVGDLPADLAGAAYDAPALSAWAYQTCSTQFKEFLGADDSLVMRSVVNWAWFRPSSDAWDEGARWYRCDAVGGGEQSKTYTALPETARGIMAARPEKRDKWMVCAQGPSVDAGTKVPCTRPHNWRAVGTIKAGAEDDPFPGERRVEVTTRDYCSDYVGAWLGYPDEYDYGYTYFHEAEWNAGNRRSVCWAKTTQ